MTWIRIDFDDGYDPEYLEVSGDGEAACAWLQKRWGPGESWRFSVADDGEVIVRCQLLQTGVLLPADDVAFLLKDLPR